MTSPNLFCIILYFIMLHKWMLASVAEWTLAWPFIFHLMITSTDKFVKYYMAKNAIPNDQ